MKTLRQNLGRPLTHEELDTNFLSYGVPVKTKLKKEYTIGVYYHPGWKDNTIGNGSQTPWEQIKPYPEKKPLIGWYPEGETWVAEAQIQQMYEHGIDYVAYDIMWNEQVFNNKLMMDHATQAHLNASNKHLVKFCFLWANLSTVVPRTMGEFTGFINVLITQFFNQPNYFKIDGKPVVFIFSQQNFSAAAINNLGTTVDALLQVARDMAVSAGLNGIFFVGNGKDWSGTFYDMQGCDAISAYNYHRGASTATAHGYADLALGYKHIWNQTIATSPVPIIPTISGGWDKRPWGGSSDPLHDNSVPTPSEFEAHLIEAKNFMDANPSKTKNKTFVICAWNEFGEGSYIEPTEMYGTALLQKLKSVLGYKVPQASLTEQDIEDNFSAIAASGRSIVKKSQIGRSLTWAEMDANFSTN